MANQPTPETDQQHDPCPYCCNCQQKQDLKEFCHHDKTSPKVTAPPKPNGKNIRGLTVNASKAKTLNIATGPPLSPITEVSSVASSTLSLAPITSPNSMTSLLPRGKQPQLKPNSKSVTWKLRSSSMSLKDDNVALNDGEADAFLSSQTSDAESGIDDSELKTNTKNSPIYKSNGKSNNTHSYRKRYLGNTATACYDSGYATSNYEEEDEERVLKNHLVSSAEQTYKNNLKQDLLS